MSEDITKKKSGPYAVNRVLMKKLFGPLFKPFDYWLKQDDLKEALVRCDEIRDLARKLQSTGVFDRSVNYLLFKAIDYREKRAILGHFHVRNAIRDIRESVPNGQLKPAVPYKTFLDRAALQKAYEKLHAKDTFIVKRNEGEK